MRKGTFALALAFGVVATLLAAGPVQAQGATIDVLPGDSIQAAVHQAQPGDTIVVHAGTYTESVSIHKDDLTLMGEGTGDTGTILNPGQDQRVCGHGAFGICIGSKQKTVTGVHITGLQVSGFPVFGVIGFGVADLVVEGNALLDDGEYGAAAFGSTGTQMLNNTASGNSIGLYIGDSPQADATISGNQMTDNHGFGLFLRSAATGEVFGNEITGNCVGIFMLNEGTITPSHWNIHDNVIEKNNTFCPGGDEGDGSFSGTGVAIVGGDRNTVTGNVIRRNVAARHVDVSGGVVLVSTPGVKYTHPDRNRITGNELIRNRPNIVTDGTGHRNVLSGNHCVGACR